MSEFEISDSEITSDNPTDALGTAFSKDIRPYIDVIDKLRRFGLQQDINLPNVVVVGDQSSGKSSIIEAISGIELPRGKNIVTRCPLELQLKKVIKKPWKATLTYKTLDGTSEKVETYEPHEVEKYVREAQRKMCTTKKGISAELITLRVESPAETAPDLTLIDLPGIARIAIEDQPTDICQQIKRIIMKYVQNENTVILCVVSANLDVAVNESIQIAKYVDPDGKRTFGVITKPDTANEESKEDVLFLLNNEKIPLKKGYHMVKCRSQRELEDNLSLEESLEREKDFFENDRYYCTANSNLIGTMNLALKITEELVQVIQLTLPDLEKRIDLLLSDTEQKLAKLGSAIPEDKSGKLVYLLDLMKDMSRETNTFLTIGKVDHNGRNLFHYWRTLFERFAAEIETIKTRAMSRGFSEEKLKDEISKRRNNEISGFLNFELFQTLVKDHVLSYKPAATNILKEMKDATCSMLLELIDNNFSHLPLIVKDLKHLTTEHLNLASEETLQRINITFEEEKLVFTMDEEIEKEMKNLDEEYKNSNNPRSGRRSAAANFNAATPVLERQYSDASEMRDIIKCYLKLVRVRLSDKIPMTIRQRLHVEFSKSLDRKFIEYFASKGVLEKVSENSKLTNERSKLHDKIERLQLAKFEIGKL